MQRLTSRFAALLGPPVLGADGGSAIVAEAPPVPLRKIFQRFWPYARPYRPWLALTAVFVLLGPAIETATIGTFKVLVDEVLVPRDLAPFGRIALAYTGLVVLNGLVSFGDDYLSTWVSQRFLLDLRTTFFHHLHGLSLDFFERRRLGDVISRLTGDIGAIETFALSGVADALSYVLRILFFGAALVYLHWGLALVALVAVPGFALLARHFARLVKRVSREKRRRSGSISSVAEESLANVALVQAYNRQGTEVERFHEQNVGAFRAQMAATRLKAVFAPVVDILELAGVLLVMGAGTWALAQDTISLGGLLVFFGYLGRLYSPVKGLGRLSNSFYSASAAAERIIEFLDQRPSVVERPQPISLRRARGLVELDVVSFRYPGTDCDALSQVSFRVEPGQTLAIVGPSGAGKSTVAKLLLRFYDPADGRVLLDGYDVRNLALRSLRENVAVLFQEALIFDGTVRENIAYGRPSATEAEIRAAAEAAGAHTFVAALSGGYATSVGQKGRRLSGGQRQRIAIARAMLRDAPVLLLDEPTTGLDAAAAAGLLRPLLRLMDGRTTIIISHNLSAVREADVILVLDQGQVVERGTHAELLARRGAYAHLYRLHHGPPATASEARSIGA